jgi:hypothetical protein
VTSNYHSKKHIESITIGNYKIIYYKNGL